MMTNQLKNSDELVGKTIAFVTDPTWEPKCGIRFTDGTFVILQAENGWDGSDATMSIDCDEPDDGVQFDLGLIDKNEWLRREDAKKQKLVESHLKRERDEYERLRAKFEGAVRESR